MHFGTQPLGLQSTYDLVSCQFALHYAWGTEADALQALRNAADVLRPGGAIVLTFPDAERIVDLLFRVVVCPDEHHYSRREGATVVYRVGGPRHHLEFRTDLPFMDFIQSFQTQPFGQRYIYHQDGAVLGVPEYMVEPGHLRDMATSLGLRVALDANFATFKHRDPSLAKRMGAHPHMAQEPDAITRLYRALVLTRSQAAKRGREEGQGHSTCNET